MKNIERSHFIGACFSASWLLLVLAWGGLTLPFDFQPDPNYSHVLFGLHLADTNFFVNTFYPGVPTFYWLAFLNHLLHVPLPSSHHFNLAVVRHATDVARAGQYLLTVFTVTAWLWVYTVLTSFQKNTLAFLVGLWATAFLLVFNYGTIYSAYFIRPDNTLSLAFALGVVLLAKMRTSITTKGILTATQLGCFGGLFLLLTITKNQGQAFMLVTTALLAVWYFKYKPSIQETRFRSIHAHFLVTALLLLLIVATIQLWPGFFIQSKIFVIALFCLIVITELLWAVTGYPIFRAFLFVLGGWAISFFLLSLIIRNMQSVIMVSNPLQSVFAQLDAHNINVSWESTSFILTHIRFYEFSSVILCAIGLFTTRRKISALLFLGGWLMVFITSLRIPGYYNLILFTPFFAVGAGIVISVLCSMRKGRFFLMMIVFPFLALQMAMNVMLQASFINTYSAVCAERNSLITVRYYPDTINLKITMRNTPDGDYALYYFKVITNFLYWPQITEKLYADPKFNLLMQGKLSTCR